MGEEWCLRSEVEFTNVKELLSWLIVEGKPLELFAYMAWMVWNQRKYVSPNKLFRSIHWLNK